MSATKDEEPRHALGIAGLWDEILEKIGSLDEEKDRLFDVDRSRSWADEIKLHSPDGRAVAVKRIRDKIVLEAEGRDDFDKKDQGRLRRSFVETRPDLLAKEIVRQFKLLLDAYTPLWASSEEQKAKAGKERKIRHERSLEIAKILKGPSRGAKVAVSEPDEDEEHEYEAAKIRALLPPVAPDHALTKVSIQVGEDGTYIEFDGPVSPAVAAAVAEALAPYLAAGVACERKGCKQRNLMDQAERTQKRCHEHRKWD